MRYSTFLSLCAAAALSISTPLAAYANSQQAETLAEIESKGLQAVGSERLERMIAESASANEIEFTRSWLAEQPKASGGEQWKCLSEALYFEARGETVKGQFAVAEVILNRVKSDDFPGSLCNVIHQGTGKKYQCQFTYTCDGYAEVISEPRAYDRVSKIARAVLDGKVPSLTDGATYYHTTAVSPRWSRVFTRTAKIGVHLFYRDGVRTASN
ncbi:cell wall hydrolase [Sulfitobacter sp. AS59]|uniref:cell wall hydrolase n=1 Tax=Sulfitobacter sp. AS59 TaxID=3135784 RepID=UPI0030F68295